MLEPRETDLPALLLVLVVFPLVIYILLGKWSETSEKKERISLLAQLAAEEAFMAESVAAASVIPLVPAPKKGIRECARCSAPATTRCSQCKSVRYCSGKCQIIHWRQVHKHECQRLETNSGGSSPMSTSNEDAVYAKLSPNGRMSPQVLGYNIKHLEDEKSSADDRIQHSTGTAASSTTTCTSIDAHGASMMEGRSMDRQVSRNSKLRREDEAQLNVTEEASRSRVPASTLSSKEAKIRHKFKSFDSVPFEEVIPRKQNVNDSGGFYNGHVARSTMHESCDLQSRECFPSEGITLKDETVESNCTSEMSSIKRSIEAKSASHSPGTKMHKSQKSVMKASRDKLCSEMERKGQIADEPKSDSIPVQGGNGVASMGIMKMIGLRKSSKLGKSETTEVGERQKKLKMLFPYEEFVKLFRYEVFDLSPRGLINCGNSCYANAVLQCLTFTKPLTIYLLRGSHSRACRMKEWCLMCELEQHVMMLRESGGPLSPGRILSHMRSLNRQIGDGSQEDAHEFLRLLVTSMQSICLEGLGGENVVDPRLQETTFIQHTFRGRLKSKVKCLRCHHESERYENIMDLTLEIFGWVESLEDALTQFTTPEDLDGENMYRCGRCAAYVRARKQLSIHEAPNILTIVLKRFQEGSYGKINKSITFPDMLDMVPFMTGTDDIPPLYLLYAVVVHLDTLNASFSGHYVSYVKDLQDNWLRIDDTEVLPVPISQVMSEGAYILFYMRSSPRPARSCSGKQSWLQTSGYVRHCTSKSQKPSRPGQSKSSSQFVGSEPLLDLRRVNRHRPPSMEFSDATSSDWSIFTSSDEASFTTESTRDSFSTVDYADACNTDPVSSIFDTVYVPEYSSHRTISCRMFSSSKPQTRFALEGKGMVLDSYLSAQPLDRVQRGEYLKEVTPTTETFLSDVNYGFGGHLKDDTNRTFSPCVL
ncbi:ubiquitin carboxyl-terminal hydrolase 15 isoform X2 [Diospyros lotus]|uniref:ubiquitin carboxyl-terminal hydrolase 15 isoform X2 n=1 Tax=Diospyros lotus TaxID=55363 RepID=UPI002252844A|nr:ubiquitin carboxyl-terminal hydrolase 15 isoform X2 [Diospyros lotus]